MDPFPTIFQGKLKDTRKSVHRFGKDLDVLILRDLKTVNNGVYGVKKNSTYNLITIFPKCKDVKMVTRCESDSEIWQHFPGLCADTSIIMFMSYLICAKKRHTQAVRQQSWQV